MSTSTVEQSLSPAPDTAAGCSAAFRYSLEGDQRFISHHDELRMLVRALKRAGWPLAYSQGFNPQPRLTLPLPRRVGTGSNCEWAVARLCEIPPIAQLFESLAAVLPPGCILQRVLMLPPRAKLHPSKAIYKIELDKQHAELIASRIPRLMESERLEVERAYGPHKPARLIDIRPRIKTVTLDGRTLTMQLVFVDQSTARPVEVLTALSLPAEIYHHRVRQVEVAWDIALAESAPGPDRTERNQVGQEENYHAQTKDHA